LYTDNDRCRYDTLVRQVGVSIGLGAVDWVEYFYNQRYNKQQSYHDGP